MKKLNVYLSDLVVGNFLLHNLHWNIKGRRFKSVHEYLEQLYDDSFIKIDEVAELQKMQGEFPAATLKDYLALTTVKEIESKDYEIKEALDIALKYLKDMKKLALDVRAEADKDGNFQVVNMMETHVEGFDKEIWFINNMAV